MLCVCFHLVEHRSLSMTAVNAEADLPQCRLSGTFYVECSAARYTAIRVRHLA